MIEADALVRHPISANGKTLLDLLLKHRREGDLIPLNLQDASDELGWPVASARAAGQELNERRVLVCSEPGVFAPLRWPLLTELSGKRLWLSLAEELAAAGAEVPADLAQQWTEAEESGDVPPPEPGGDTPADECWLMLRLAHHARLAEALRAARHATAATVGTAVVPLLARAAAWLSRALTVLGDPASPALRYELPLSEEPRALSAYRAGWNAELLRNREGARASYEEAARLDPSFHRARLRRARASFALGYGDAALAEVGEVIAQNPALSAATLLRAGVLIGLAEEGEAPTGWEDQAKADITVTGKDPRGDRSLASLLASRLLLQRGDAPRAAAAARQAIGLEPGRADNYYALGQALTQAGDWLAAAWAQVAALLADHEYMTAGEALFHLRRSPEVGNDFPQTKAIIDESWQ